MDSNHWILIIIFFLVIGGILFCLLRGVVKMVLFFLSIIGGAVTYYVLQKYGFNYLAFITDSPSEWMVTAIAVLGAVIVFAAFRHGLSWFSNLFSWGGKVRGAGGAGGILTTICMGLFVSWLISVGIFYFGSLSELRRYKELSANPEVRDEIPVLANLKQLMENSIVGKYLVMFDPLSDPERLKLAKIVAYMAGEENDELLMACEARLEQYLPSAKRINNLAHDKGIRTSMKKNDMGALLNDSKLTRLMSDQSIKDALKKIDPDTLFGMTVVTDKKDNTPEVP